MGCAGGLTSPYEHCAFLLREYELSLRKRKDNYFNTKKEIEKKKIDKNVKEYRSQICDNLDKINKTSKSEIEVKKLKQLNELFQILLTEESNIYNDKKEENYEKNIQDNSQNEKMEKEIQL